MSGASGAVKRKANTPEDWRENVKHMTTPERNYYRYMLDHDIFTDCMFVVGLEGGETREFKAHRLHIARLSPVFEAMLLRGEMVEAKTGHVRVTDLSPTTFQLLISYIYGKMPKLTNFLEAQDLAFAAHKYQMKMLLEICVARLIALLSAEHIWTAFETADLLQDKSIKETCIQLLQLNTLQCITNPIILQISEDHMALLLQQDELNVEEELDLINMVVYWARHEARRRGLTGDDEGVRAVIAPLLLLLLRFLAIEPHQFVTGPGLAGWLTSEEKAAIYECLLTKDFSKVPQNLSCVPLKRKRRIDVASAGLKDGKGFPGNIFYHRKSISPQPNEKKLQYYQAEIRTSGGIGSAVSVRLKQLSVLKFLSCTFRQCLTSSAKFQMCNFLRKVQFSNFRCVFPVGSCRNSAWTDYTFVITSDYFLFDIYKKFRLNDIFKCLWSLQQQMVLLFSGEVIEFHSLSNKRSKNYYDSCIFFIVASQTFASFTGVIILGEN